MCPLLKGEIIGPLCRHELWREESTGVQFVILWGSLGEDASTPALEAFTFTTNWREGSERVNTVAEENKLFNCLKAASADRDHT